MDTRIRYEDGGLVCVCVVEHWLGIEFMNKPTWKMNVMCRSGDIFSTESFHSTDAISPLILGIIVSRGGMGSQCNF